WWRRKNVLEQILSADRRCRPGGIRRHRQKRGFAEQAETLLIGERDGPEVAAIHAGHTVVPRELFIEERLARREQIDDAAVFFQLGVEEQLHFPDERDAQVVVEP